MSKLPNAPLVEIVLELRWTISNKTDLSKVQYLYGDLYAELKNKYPFRESIVPAEIAADILINQPVHRFRCDQNDYPLFQVGPGIITLNTVDNKYYWDTFSNDAAELIDSFLKVYPLNSENNLIPGILFIDFFPFDFEKNDVYQFVSHAFNIEYSQTFIENKGFPKDIHIGFYYEVPAGNLSVTFSKGKNSERQEGIVLQTRIDGKPLSSVKQDILSWIEISHEICSDVFKKLTAGELYESFKS